MVFAGILDGARLATYRIGGLDAGGSTFLYGKAHSLYDRCVSLGLHLRLAAGKIALVGGVLVDMRHVEPPAIGNGHGQIAQLEWSTGDVALTHACPPDSLAVPSAIATPSSDCLVFRLIHKVVVDHRGEGHQKPSVARLGKRILESQRRAVLVAAHLDISVGDAVVAFYCCFWCDDTLGEQREGLRCLECGTGSQGLPDGLPHVSTVRRVGCQT